MRETTRNVAPGYWVVFLDSEGGGGVKGKRRTGEGRGVSDERERESRRIKGARGRGAKGEEAEGSRRKRKRKIKGKLERKGLNGKGGEWITVVRGKRSEEKERKGRETVE